MKLAWFAPFSTQSAIGKVGAQVCAEFSKNHEVDIWTPPADKLLSAPEGVNVRVIRPDRFPQGFPQPYDHIIYNLGNFAGFHREIYEAVRRRPGVVIVHDRTMHGFFYQSAVLPEYGGDPAGGPAVFGALLEAYYGQPGRYASETFYGQDGLYHSSLENAALIQSEFPLLRPALQNALAAFTHSRSFLDTLKGSFNGPSDYAYLPVAAGSSGTKIKKDGRLTLLSLGIVHPVKHIRYAADMLLQNPDIRGRVRYVVVGGYGGEYGEYLEQLAGGVLKGALHMAGYLPDSEMEAYLSEADICLNLRYPNSEAGSLSLLEQMAAGKPVIVFDSGIFGEMPDDAVVKIARDGKTETLAEAVRFLLGSEEERTNIGRRAAEFAGQNCTAKNYADKLEQLLTGLAGRQPFTRIVNGVLDRVNASLRQLGFNEQSAPAAVNSFTREAFQLFNRLPAAPPPAKPGRVLGVWVGFPYAVSLRREGITKFLAYMLKAMLQKFPVSCEIWCYSFNEEEVREGFKELLQDMNNDGRVSIITEQNWADPLYPPASLAGLARTYSKADCFVPAIFYLDDVVYTGRPVFVPAHDMSVSEFYNDFVASDALYKARHIELQSRAEHLARNGAFFFSITDAIRRGHILRYIKNIRPENTAAVYLPVIIPDGIKDRVIERETLFKKFNIRGRYLFYPTQVRPYKNIQMLVRVLARMDGDVALVLTGDPNDISAVRGEIAARRLQSRVISLPGVSEDELYSLYKYAGTVTVTSTFEGGFPLQALEALYMDAPLVLSNILHVSERLASLGIDTDDPGFGLFEPGDEDGCVREALKALADPEAARARQRDAAEKLTAYSWADAAEIYYRLFFGDHAGLP